MIKKYIVYTLLCFIPQTSLLAITPIKAICFDVETVLETDDMRAANYVGKVDSLRYLRQVGHLPCQKDLFAQLMKAPAESTEYTYNNELRMPLIFSDWLMSVQPAPVLLTKILNFLQSSKISDIEKTIFSNIIKMMFTPTSLIDTRKVIKPTEQLLNQLKQKGYKLYLTGNWIHVDVLRQNFDKLLTNFSGIFVSGKLQELKPSQDFYTAVLQNIHLTAADVLWIERESHFVSKAKQYNLNMILYNPKHVKDTVKELQQFGINV